jgi:tetratricopeptide (TPR) repeat protein
MLKPKYTIAIALTSLGMSGVLISPQASIAFEELSASTTRNLISRQNQIKTQSWQIADAVETAKIYYSRAQSKAQAGDYQGAIADYSEVIRLVPEYDKPYVYRGNLLDDLGDQTGAIRDYTQAIQINPQNALAYYNRGITLEKLEQRDQAIADYSQTIQLQPDFVSAHKNRGLNHLAVNNIPGAIQDFRSASQLYQAQGNAEGYQQMQQILKALGQ